MDGRAVRVRIKNKEEGPTITMQVLLLEFALSDCLELRAAGLVDVDQLDHMADFIFQIDIAAVYMVALPAFEQQAAARSPHRRYRFIPIGHKQPDVVEVRPR